MKPIRYTEEEKQFFREFIPGHSYKHIAEEFTRRFRPITSDQARAFCKNNKIRTGRTGRFRRGMPTWNKGKHYQAGGRCVETQFKKGHIPANWKPVGSERVNVDGYVEIKIREPNKWTLKHRHVWQQHYGDIPKGNMIVFKDGNRLNTDIDNLMMISNGLNARLSNLGLQNAREAGALEEAVMTAKIAERIGRLTNDNRRNQQKDRRGGRDDKDLQVGRKRRRRRTGAGEDPEAEGHAAGEGGSRPKSRT